jgi:hypothetical protein
LGSWLWRLLDVELDKLANQAFQNRAGFGQVCTDQDVGQWAALALAAVGAPE